MCEAPLFYVLRDVAPENVEPIIDAADYWNVVLGERVFMYGGVDKDKDIEPSPHILVITQLEKLINNSCGWAYSGTAANGCINHPTILFRTGCMDNKARTETLARHEFGHILGLDNSDNPTHIMYRSASSKHNYWVVEKKATAYEASDSEVEKLKEMY